MAARQRDDKAKGHVPAGADGQAGLALNQAPDLTKPSGRLRRIIEHFRDTRTGVDCSEAKSVW